LSPPAVERQRVFEYGHHSSVTPALSTVSENSNTRWHAGACQVGVLRFSKAFQRVLNDLLRASAF
jgi:hypothetical protein